MRMRANLTFLCQKRSFWRAVPAARPVRSVLRPRGAARSTQPTTGVDMPTEPLPFKVADLSLAEFGRKEITLAEHEMPGLMAVRAEYAQAQPLRGARITGSLHMTIQTAVLIETLVALGAQVRWASCNIFSTQDHAAAAVAVGPDGTLLVHKGAAYEQAGAVPSAGEDDPEELAFVLALLRDSLAADPRRFTRMGAGITGVTEETTTGVHRLYEMAREGTLLFPAINVNDSVTKSKFDNKYGCR